MSTVTGHRVQMRWRDLDALGHVNHPVVLTYLEEGRDDAHHRDRDLAGRHLQRRRDPVDRPLALLPAPAGTRAA